MVTISPKPEQAITQLSQRVKTFPTSNSNQLFRIQSSRYTIPQVKRALGWLMQRIQIIGIRSAFEDRHINCYFAF